MRRLRPSADRLSRALLGPSGVSGMDAAVCAKAELPVSARAANATNLYMTTSFETGGGTSRLPFKLPYAGGAASPTTGAGFGSTVTRIGDTPQATARSRRYPLGVTTCTAR